MHSDKAFQDKPTVDVTKYLETVLNKDYFMLSR